MGIHRGTRRLAGVAMGVVMALLLAVVLNGGVRAAGSGPITPFPITGAYTATHAQDRDGISVIQMAGNYDRSFADGSANLEPRAAIAQEYFRNHPDNYDFLVVFSTFEFNTGDAAAFHWMVRNDVQGIGLPQFDVSALFGSNGKLQGYIDMAALSRWSGNPLDPKFEDTLSVLSHEVLHQWASFVKYRKADGSLSDELLGRDLAHWSALLDTDASVEYGADWKDNGDGTFSARGVRTFFSPLDLYLMGMNMPAEVPPITLIDSADLSRFSLPQENITIAGTARTVTIDDIIAAEGARVPAAADAQKQFRFGFVLLTGPNEQVTDAQIVALNNIRKAFMTRFAILTGGRAVAHIYPEAKPVATTGTPTTVSGGAPRIDAANLDDAVIWLRGQQQFDGFWGDKASTRGRDTAVALDVLSRLDAGFSNAGPAADWLAAQPDPNTDYLARDALVTFNRGADATALRNALLARQNADGGWGISSGYASDPLDTALAMQALGTFPAGYRTALDGAVAYLAAAQNADGGWSGATGGPSRTNVTALAVRALKVSGSSAAGAIDTALTWLASTNQWATPWISRPLKLLELTGPKTYCC